jgi:hypothetical protein
MTPFDQYPVHCTFGVQTITKLTSVTERHPIQIIVCTPIPVPTIIAVGVAKPNAQGHAITTTLIANRRAFKNAFEPSTHTHTTDRHVMSEWVQIECGVPSGSSVMLPIMSHKKKVMNPIITTTGTK